MLALYLLRDYVGLSGWNPPVAELFLRVLVL